MKIGMGLPNPIPNTLGRLLVEWAERAEHAGFSTLATIDRLVYPVTNILIAPVYDTVLLAKEADSVHRISRGRFALGVGVGMRDDDFGATGRDFSNRGLASMNSWISCIRCGEGVHLRFRSGQHPESR